MNADLKVSLRTDAIRAYYVSNSESQNSVLVLVSRARGEERGDEHEPRTRITISTHRPFEKPSGRPICDSFFHGVKK